MEDKKLNWTEEAVENEDAAAAQAAEGAVEEERLEAAVEAMRGDIEAALEERLARLLDDALRVSRMSDEERAVYEVSRRQSDLDEREKRVTARELRAEAVELLARRGLPKELAEALGYESREKMLRAVDAVERAFRQAVQTAVEERLRGTAPAAGASAQGVDETLLDDEAYYRLTYGNR